MTHTFDELQGMSGEQLVASLEAEIHSVAGGKLTNEDPVASDMAQTNANGWGVDQPPYHPMKAPSITSPKKQIPSSSMVVTCGRTLIVSKALPFTMKRLLLIWITLGLLANAEERIWKSTDGKELTGELLEDKGEALVLKIKGKTFTVPLSRLSEDDHAWVETYRNAVEERTKEDAALAGTTKTYAKNKDQQVTYHVYYPSSYNREKPLPMLILFSAGGGGRSILKNFKMSCEDVGWIGVGCDTFKNGVDESKLDPLFEELLPIIEKTVPHNSQALYMGGMSGGASRAFEYTAKFDRPWKGVIACGGWLGKRYDLKYAKDMRVAWVNGDNDKGAGSWFGRDSAFLKKKFGVTNKLFEFPGGHEIGAPTILTEAMTWAGSKDE